MPPEGRRPEGGIGCPRSQNSTIMPDSGNRINIPNSYNMVGTMLLLSFISLNNKIAVFYTKIIFSLFQVVIKHCLPKSSFQNF